MNLILVCIYNYVFTQTCPLLKAADKNSLQLTKYFDSLNVLC